MKDNKNMKCDPCERDFEHKIHELVEEGKAPTHEARAKREHDVKAAFDEHHSAGHGDMKHPAGHADMKHPEAHAKAKHPAEKHTPAAKQHAMAGAAKMKK